MVAQQRRHGPGVASLASLPRADAAFRTHDQQDLAAACRAAVRRGHRRQHARHHHRARHRRRGFPAVPLDPDQHQPARCTASATCPRRPRAGAATTGWRGKAPARPVRRRRHLRDPRPARLLGGRRDHGLPLCRALRRRSAFHRTIERSACHGMTASMPSSVAVSTASSSRSPLARACTSTSRMSGRGSSHELQAHPTVSSAGRRGGHGAGQPLAGAVGDVHRSPPTASRLTVTAWRASAPVEDEASNRGPAGPACPGR